MDSEVSVQLQLEESRSVQQVLGNFFLASFGTKVFVCEKKIVHLLLFVKFSITVLDLSVLEDSGLFAGFDQLRFLFVVSFDFERVALDLVDRPDRCAAQQLHAPCSDCCFLKVRKHRKPFLDNVRFANAERFHSEHERDVVKRFPAHME